LEYVLIIEDDVEFEDSFFEKLNKVWFDDFDMLYLNGTNGIIRKPKVVSQNLFSCAEIYGTFAYVMNARFYDVAIEWLEREQYPVDRVYSMFIQFYKVYKLRVPLVFHREGLSDIQGVVPKNYKHLQRGRKV
jgi:GR25 family glycosyltransferase involved in LPS biosynthesis